MATTFVDYTGDGNATKSFSFPSIKEADVKVEVDNVLKTSGNHYNITSYTTTGGGNVVFTAGNIPSNPAKIRIRRDTDVDNALATYVAGSSVKAGDLNNNQKQILYAAQEYEELRPLVMRRFKEKADKQTALEYLYKSETAMDKARDLAKFHAQVSLQQMSRDVVHGVHDVSWCTLCVMVYVVCDGVRCVQ